MFGHGPQKLYGDDFFSQDAMSRKTQAKAPDPTIARNRRARHDYAIEETFEAGLALTGWEVKSLREGRAQINESYISIRKGEGWLLGSHINPLPNVSHLPADPARPRKLLLHEKEIAHLQGAVDRRGYTLIPLSLYWKQGRAKLQLALARGKHKHDRRQTVKTRDWERDRERLLRRSTRQGGKP